MHACSMGIFGISLASQSLSFGSHCFMLASYSAQKRWPTQQSQNSSRGSIEGKAMLLTFCYHFKLLSIVLVRSLQIDLIIS